MFYSAENYSSSLSPEGRKIAVLNQLDFAVNLSQSVTILMISNVQPDESSLFVPTLVPTLVVYCLYQGTFSKVQC